MRALRPWRVYLVKSNFELLANYNLWINQRIYDSANKLDPEDLSKDKGAYFSSIIGTLNHILVGDIIWLKRISNHPDSFKSLKLMKEFADPVSLSEIVHPDLESLAQSRKVIDEAIINFINEISEESILSELDYINTKGNKFTKNLGFIIQHLFNHQTHHRGQVTTMLFQSCIDVGETDLLALIPSE